MINWNISIIGQCLLRKPPILWLGLHSEDEEEDSGTYAVVWNDYGAGRIVVLQDLTFLHNEEVGDLDHVEMLLQLLDFGGRREGVLLVYNWGRDSLSTLIWKHGWLPLVAGAFCAAAMVWRRAFRTGPMAPDPPPGRRSLMEHVEAVGVFLWRNRGEATLLDSARVPVLRRVSLRRPGFGSR